MHSASMATNMNTASSTVIGSIRFIASLRSEVLKHARRERRIERRLVSIASREVSIEGDRSERSTICSDLSHFQEAQVCERSHFSSASLPGQCQVRPKSAKRASKAKTSSIKCHAGAFTGLERKRVSANAAATPPQCPQDYEFNKAELGQEASNGGPSPQTPSPLKSGLAQTKVVVLLRERK